jgi:hypothetical protein
VQEGAGSAGARGSRERAAAAERVNNDGSMRAAAVAAQSTVTCLGFFAQVGGLYTSNPVDP